MSSTFKGTIVFKKKDELIPEEYARILAAKHPTYASIAMIDKDEFDINDLSPVKVDEFMQAQELRQQDEVLFYFAFAPNMSEDVAAANMQPFNILQVGEEVQLLAFTDGDWSNHNKPKSQNSDDFFMVNEYLQPRIEKWFKRGKNDLAALHEELLDATTHEDITNTFKGRGSIVLFFKTGEVITIQKDNSDFKEYPWGFTTNNYMYKPKAAEAPAEELKPAGTKRRVLNRQSDLEQVNTEAVNDKEVKSNKDKTFSNKAEETPAETDLKPAGGKKKEETKSADTKPDADTQGNDGASLIEIMFKPNIPLGATKEQRRHIYNAIPKFNVYQKKINPQKYPEGYNKGAPCVMTVKQKELAEFIAAGWEVRSTNARVTANGKKPETKVETPLVTKDTETHNIPAPDENAGYKPFSPDKEEMEASGLLAKEKILPVQRFFADATKNKFIDTSSQVVALDPRSIQSMENKIPTASQQIGLDFEHIMRLSRPGLLALCKAHPEWFTELYIEVLGYYISGLKKDDRPKSQDHVKVPEPEKVVEQNDDELRPARRRKVA